MPNTPIEPKAGDPYPAGLAICVSRLEGDVSEVKATMSRLEMLVVEIRASHDANLRHLATKAEMAELRTERKGSMAALRADLADKPSKTCMGDAPTALLTAHACGLAALAILK